MPNSSHRPSKPGKAGQEHNSTKQSVFKCFASCPRGLEEILVAELETMGAQKTRAVTGGCTFEASWRQATRMTYWTRFAGRIGLELARGECSNEEQFYNIAKSVDWYNWFKLSNTFRVDLNNLGADIQSVRFTQLRLKDAVCDAFLERFDERPNVSVEAPDVRIFAAINPTEAMVYIDLAGENLFKRGWREEAGVAPLKENLAAGLWHIARQSEAGKNADVFLDPFCGSGTLVIESLSQLCDRAPGLERPFAFENLKPFTPEWGKELQEDANRRFNAGLDKALTTPYFHWYASDITELLIKKIWCVPVSKNFLMPVSCNLHSAMRSLLNHPHPMASCLVTHPTASVCGPKVPTCLRTRRMNDSSRHTAII